MGILDKQTPEVFEGFELKDDYYSDIALEDTGDGMIRMMRYVKKGGMLVPVLSTVCTVSAFLRHLEQVSDFARKLGRERAPIRLVN